MKRQNSKQNFPDKEFSGVTSTADGGRGEIQENDDRPLGSENKSKSPGKTVRSKEDTEIVVSCEDFDHW
jgi:hypothetical protein